MAKSTMTPWERVGVCASTLCAVHCVLTGLALGLLSVAGLGFLANPAVEIAFFAVVVGTGAWAIHHGVSKHHSWTPALVFVTGLLLIAGSHFFLGHGVGPPSFAKPVGVSMAVLGGLMVGAFHFVNRRMQHQKCRCHLCDGLELPSNSEPVKRSRSLPGGTAS